MNEENHSSEADDADAVKRYIERYNLSAEELAEQIWLRKPVSLEQARKMVEKYFEKYQIAKNIKERS